MMSTARPSSSDDHGLASELLLDPPACGRSLVVVTVIGFLSS
jgi:hypothetical protein